MATFDKYHNILRVKDNVIVAPDKGENIDPPCLSIWEVTKLNDDGTMNCVCLCDTDIEETFFSNQIIKV